jgi:bacterial/archaeal transporter family-2 protein
VPRTASLPLILSLPLAVGTGLAIPVQGRITGALGAELDDGLAAAVVSFSMGLAVMVAVSLLLPSGRAGVRRIAPVLRERRFPRWYLLAGCLGGFMVLSQGLTVSQLGIALFIVATVAGTSVSGLLVDRIGLGPAGRKAVTARRVASAALTLVAVAWAASPKFSVEAGGAWLLLVLLPLAAGFLRSFQQAMNGTATVHYGTPLTATLINFAAGSLALWMAWLVKVAVAGAGNPLPSEWWYYLAGPMGCVFVIFTNILVRSLGVLLAGIGMIASQLLGSLALDAWFPAPGTTLTTATVLGTLLAMAALLLATVPAPRWASGPGGPAPQRSGTGAPRP